MTRELVQIGLVSDRLREGMLVSLSAATFGCSLPSLFQRVTRDLSRAACSLPSFWRSFEPAICP